MTIDLRSILVNLSILTTTTTYYTIVSSSIITYVLQILMMNEWWPPPHAICKAADMRTLQNRPARKRRIELPSFDSNGEIKGLFARTYRDMEQTQLLIVLRPCAGMSHYNSCGWSFAVANHSIFSNKRSYWEQWDRLWYTEFAMPCRWVRKCNQRGKLLLTLF